jgi:hypothetical protein
MSRYPTVHWLKHFEFEDDEQIIVDVYPAKKLVHAFTYPSCLLYEQLIHLLILVDWTSKYVNGSQRITQKYYSLIYGIW